MIQLATGEVEVVGAADGEVTESQAEAQLQLTDADLLGSEEDEITAVPAGYEPASLDAAGDDVDEHRLSVEAPPAVEAEPEPLFPSALAPAPDEGHGRWRAERAFYVHEAQALAARQPERAALMWVEAASAGELGDLGIEQVHDDVDAALALRPDTTWLVRRARRMMMRLGSFERALRLGQAEVRLGGEAGARAAVLVEGAAVIRYQLGKPQPALKLVEQALQLRARYVPALAWAVALRAELGLHEAAAEALEILGECLTDPAQRALCLYGAGTIRDALLDRVGDAQAAYTRAAESDPQNVPVQLALVDLHAATENWQPLCRALEHLADLLDDPRDKARLLLQAGSLHLDRTGNLDAASRDLSRAVRARPDNAAALQRLVYTYEAKGATRDLVQTLRELLQLTPDKQGRAALLTQIAMLHASLHEIDQAIAAYREALNQVEGFLPALQALGMIFRHKGDFESLVAISEPETEGLLPPAARAVRHVELAEILAGHLDRPEDAVVAYSRALDLAPDLRLAFWGQAQLLRQLGRHEQLADLLARQAGACADPRTRAHLLLERARLQAGPLGQPAAAIETLLPALAEDQGSASMTFELLELYSRTGANVELVSLLLEQAERTKDPAEAQGRKIQAAQVLELELEEYDRALELYREVLAASPASHAALHGAGRVLHQQGAWSDLIKLHHHELVTDPERPDASILLCRVGRILTEHLGNRGAAIKAYSKALRQDPNCTPALVALDGLVRQEKRWPELVEVLEQYAAAQNDAAAAAMALCRAAEVACWQLGALEQAAGLFERSLAAQRLEIALHGLLQVRLRQRRWREAVECTERLLEQSTSIEHRSALLLHQARLRELRLGEPPDLGLYAQAAQGPFGSKLREELLRVQRRTAAPEVMAEHLADLGRKTTDDALGAAYLLEAAYLREFGGTTSAVGLEDATDAYRRRPEDLATIWCLERALLKSGQWRSLAELCEREAQLELDRAVRVQRLTCAAESYRRAGDTEEATRVCRECLNFDAHCLPALRLLSRLAEEQQRWRQLAELTDRLAEACTDPANRLQSCLRAAEVWTDKVGDTTRALASLAVALADDPGQGEAFGRAEQLMRERRDFDELSRLYQRRIRACDQPVVKVSLLHQHASLLGQDLKRPDRAIAELNTLLELKPDDVDALSLLAELHGTLGHWSDAAATLGQLIERAADAGVRHRARLRQADLWLQRLHEPKRARVTLEQAAAERPDDLDVTKLMVSLAMNVGDWNEARVLLEGIAASPDAGVRSWALLRLVEVAQLGLRDDELAQRSTAAAVRLAARDEGALAALREHFPTPAERNRLAEMARQLASDVPAGEASVLLELAAQILLEDVGQPAKAVSILRELEQRQPGGQATLLLARALEQQGDGAQAAERYLLLAENDVASIEAYRGLVRTADPEIAAAAATVVELLGEVGPEETVQLKLLEIERGPRGGVDARDVELEGAQRQVGEILDTLLPYLQEVFPRTPGRQVAAEHPAVSWAHDLARALGLSEIRIETAVDDSSVSVGIGHPLPLLVGQTMLDQAEQPVLRFWIAHALAGALSGGAVVRSLKDDELDDLFAAIYARRPPTEEAQRLKKMLGRLIPRKVRKQLESHDPPAVSARVWQDLRRTIEARADRLALVLCRHPAKGLLEIALSEHLELNDLFRAPRLVSLLRFTVSPDYARMCRQVWS